MVLDELVEGVELHDPEKVLAGVVSENLEVLHVYTRRIVHPGDTPGRQSAEAR